ncbi:hypothetical protein [Streptomyces sp. NPDC020965]|uniref:hypothetical protein n=1 Tax=Streptomyces sp. NPDC020965 TaxID=3365105 RepID=UPI0037B10DDB
MDNADLDVPDDDLTRLAGDLDSMQRHLDSQVRRMDAVVDRIEAGGKGGTAKPCRALHRGRRRTRSGSGRLPSRTPPGGWLTGLEVRLRPGGR